MHTKPLIDDPLLDESAVRKHLGGIAKPTLYNHIKKGLVPRPLKIGGLSRWRRSWIEAVIDRAEREREVA